MTWNASLPPFLRPRLDFLWLQKFSAAFRTKRVATASHSQSYTFRGMGPQPSRCQARNAREQRSETPTCRGEAGPLLCSLATTACSLCRNFNRVNVPTARPSTV